MHYSLGMVSAVLASKPEQKMANVSELMNLREMREQAHDLCATALRGAQPSAVYTNDGAFWMAFRAEMRWGKHPAEFQYLLSKYHSACAAIEAAVRGTRYAGIGGEFA